MKFSSFSISNRYWERVAFALGNRSFVLRSTSCSSFLGSNRSRTAFVNTISPSRTAPTTRSYRTLVRAQRATWLLGLDPPPYLDGTVVKHYSNMNQRMPLIYVKLYTYQIFRGLAYIHMVPGVCHRDVKPQNILVDPLTHEVKLCDFGSAKILVRGEANISYICSRYYRAPELIFGATEYTTSIGIWSAGCVLAELLLGQPLFPGDSVVDQLVEIIKRSGAKKLVGVGYSVAMSSSVPVQSVPLDQQNYHHMPDSQQVSQERELTSNSMVPYCGAVGQMCSSTSGLSSDLQISSVSSHENHSKNAHSF